MAHRCPTCRRFVAVKMEDGFPIVQQHELTQGGVTFTCTTSGVDAEVV